MFACICGVAGECVPFHVHIITSGVVHMQDKIKVSLSGVSETLLFCLWGRAQLSKKYRSMDVRRCERNYEVGHAY